MTSEEAIEFIAQSVKSDIDMAKVADAIKALKQESRWIPVSERLPEVADCYTVTRQIGDDLMVGACYFDGTNTWHDDKWINHERNYLTDIVAWMPKPQPYREGGKRMTDNDYIAEYVKERCPELLDSVDFSVWKLRRAVGEVANALLDQLSKIGGKLNATESEEEDGN